jgi:DNA-binding LacI/PurR family transcriptional regulator
VAVTLRDVAAHAGVSPRTVSNVVNGYRYVSPATRARVQASLEELRYQPNLLARSLRRGRTGIITLLIPRIDVPYFSELAHEVVERASRLGVTVLIDETGGLRDRELALLDLAASSRWVDGVLLSFVGLDDKALSGLAGTRVPVVLLGERTARTGHDHVGYDNVAAARDATQHLLDTGRRRIGAVGGPADRADATSELRLAGYRAALDASGLPPNPGWYVSAPYTREQAARAVADLLATADAPDGLVCFSAEHAVGTLSALHGAGLRVPDDVGVVTFDDVEECRFATPPLTSVGPNKADVAATALDMLLERADGSTVGPRDVRVPYVLQERSSSAPPRDGG